MAYYSRTPRSTTRKSYRKTYRKRSTMAKPRTAVGKLYQKVNKLQKAVVPLTQNKMFYKHWENLNIGSATGASAISTNLSRANNWTRIFGTDADDESSHVFMQQRMELRGQVNANGERNLINTTLFVVSLTKIGAAELFNPLTGVLNNLVAEQHYTLPTGFQGLAITLNPRFFRIHWAKRIYTGSPGNLATDTYDLNRPFVYIHKKPIKWVNPSGDWRAKGFCPNEMGNLFLLSFCNDNTVDSDVSMTYNAVFTGTAV